MRDPLWHFLILGASVFLLQRWWVPTDAPRRVVVTAGVQRALIEEHKQRFGAAPTPDETHAMIDRWIDDEVRVREALTLGLDRDDIIVRRRLVQKMDYVLQDSVPLVRATDAELQAWLSAHPERYVTAPRLSFEHIFAATDRHPQDAAAQLAAWRARAVAGEAATTLGDPFLRGRVFERQSAEDIAAVFGAGFAAALPGFTLGEWSAPVQSSYGWHTVRLSASEPGRTPSLADARGAVERDWREAQRATLDQHALEQLRRGYEITQEPPAP